MDGGVAVTLSELERNTQKLAHFQEDTLIPNRLALHTTQGRRGC
jgi:hypothetical protein